MQTTPKEVGPDTKPHCLQWLVLPDEKEKQYTNFGYGRPGDASELVTRVNADSALNQGHADWRLPTIDELENLRETDSELKSGNYWSSSPHEGFRENTWGLDFIDGFIDGYNNYDCRLLVRLVRTSQ